MTWMTYKGNVDHFKNFSGFESLFVKILEILFSLKKEKNQKLCMYGFKRNRIEKLNIHQFRKLFKTNKSFKTFCFVL